MTYQNPDRKKNLSGLIVILVVLEINNTGFTCAVYNTRICDAYSKSILDVFAGISIESMVNDPLL